MFDEFEAGDAGVVAPDLTATPRAHVKDVIKGGFNHASMANGDDGLLSVSVYKLLDEIADPNAEMHEALTHLSFRGDRGERSFTTPEVTVFWQVVARPGYMVEAVVANLAQTVVANKVHIICRR
jgi:hypothetical protein